MKRNIFILLIVAAILIVFSILIFASETIDVKDYIKDKFPSIFSFYLSSLEDLDSYEKEFIDLLQNLPEEEQKNFAKEVYNNGFSKEILEKIKKEGTIAKTETEIEEKKAEYNWRGTKFAYIDLPDGQQLKIEYGNDIIYGIRITKEGEKNNFSLHIGSENYFRIYDGIVVKNKLVKIIEYDLKIKYASLTPDIATINEFGRIDFKGEGLAKFKISAFDFSNNAELGDTTIEVKVIKLPLYMGMPLDEVVEEFGFPDKETQKSYEWYDNYGLFEGIFYSFSSNGYGALIKHWSYNKYPYLKMAVAGSSFYNAYTQGWDSGYDIGMNYYGKGES